jgi:hypothetical protein
MSASHLSARELVDLWPDGPAHPHLAGCKACRSEYDELAAVMLAARDASDAADGHFTSERLAAQHAHILRRLENAERPAKVLHFPSSSRPTPVVRGGVRRWIAAAAAAGLLTGIFAGRALDFSFARRGISTPAFDGAGEDRLAVRNAGARPASRTDESLLGEIEAALIEPRVDELRAIDAFTPLVREASFTR